MRRDLLKRLETVERKHGPDDNMPASINIIVVDSEGKKLPVLGWRETQCKDPREVYREPGESDEALEARAAALFKESPWRQPKSVPVMVAITE